MIERKIIAAAFSSLLLASCGQQKIQSRISDFKLFTNVPAQMVKGQKFSSNRTMNLEIHPASELPNYLKSNPDVEVKLRGQGVLDEVLSNAAKAAISVQQTTGATSYCPIDYGTTILYDQYVYGEAVMTCSATFKAGTSLEIFTTRDPNFDRRDGVVRAGYLGTRLQVQTSPPAMNYIDRQNYCTNVKAFVALADGRYGASPANSPYDCVRT